MNKPYNMKYNVVKGTEVVKKNLSKKQAEEYCDKMNKEFKEKQESIRKQQHNAGLPLRKGKYDLYKVEVVKESNIVRLSEQELVRLIKRVINKDNSVNEDFDPMVGIRHTLNDPFTLILATTWLLTNREHVKSNLRDMKDSFIQFCNSMGYPIDKDILDYKFYQLINMIKKTIKL